MSVPKQEKQNRKKCLLPDEGANVNAAVTGRGNLIFPQIFWRLFFSFSKIKSFLKNPFFLKNRCQTIGIHCSCCTSSSISWSNWCWWIKEIICKVSKNKQTKQKQNKKNRLKFDLRTRIFILLSWNGSC